MNRSSSRHEFVKAGAAALTTTPATTRQERKVTYMHLKQTLASVTVALLLGSFAQAADTYNIDPAHTRVGFAARHFGGEAMREPESARKAYCLDSADKPTADFGKRCLLATRLIERGVRFVQVWSGPEGAVNNWDNHGNIPTQLPPMTASIDKPIAALLRDLRQRGLAEDTLVVWTSEFGRTPFSQGSLGRDAPGLMPWL